LQTADPYTQPNEAVRAAATSLLHSSGNIQADLKPVPSTPDADRMRLQLRARINDVCAVDLKDNEHAEEPTAQRVQRDRA